MASALFLRNLFQSDNSIESIITLGLTVWIIYTLDHLLDARMIPDVAKSFRHRLHQSFFFLILMFWIVAFFFNIHLVYTYLNIQIIWGGILLSGLVSIHFLICRFTDLDDSFPTKELRIAILYVLGISLASISLQTKIQLDTFLILAFFILVAFINLLLFSILEYEQDKSENMTNIRTVLSGNVIDKLITISFILAELMLVLICLINGFEFLYRILPLFLMPLILILIHRNIDKYRTMDKYRIVGDAVFILPILSI